MKSVVLKAIMKRYGGLENLYSAMRECEDTVIVNLEDDINGEYDMYQILDMIHQTL